jgi:hypothetical protein
MSYHHIFTASSLILICSLMEHEQGIQINLNSHSEIPDQEIAIEGTWHGRSTCTNPASSCRDEEVVYHISYEKKPDLLRISADKIVDGKTINMGDLLFTYDKGKGVLSNNSGKRQWQLIVKENHMDGTLMVDQEMFRKISLTKENK